MVFLLAALVVAGAIVWGTTRITSELAATREAASRDRVLNIFATFAPAAIAAAADPRAVLVWDGMARTGRRLFPGEFEQLDRATGDTFPFGPERIQAAHAQWTTDWLAWESAHDAEFKVKAAMLADERERDGASAALRARVDTVEREKLDRYQRRYEEYVRVAKALQAATLDPTAKTRP